MQQQDYQEPPKVNGESTPEVASVPHQSPRSQIFVLTARSKTAAMALVQNLISYLKERESVDLSSLAHTLFSRRSTLTWRIGVAAATVENLIVGLGRSDLLPRRALQNPKVGFVFTGQGAQWHAMGRELLSESTVFRETILNADRFYGSLGATWSLMGMYALLLLLRRTLELKT